MLGLIPTPKSLGLIPTSFLGLFPTSILDIIPATHDITCSDLKV